MTKEEVRKTVQKELFVLQDLKYRDFHAKLIPSVDKEKVIGIRTPALRAYAKKFGKKEWIMYSATFSVVVYAILFFFPLENPLLFIIINGICYLGVSGFQVLVWALVNDAIDYQELQTGKRNEGIVYSAYTFFRKLANAVSGSMSSFALAIAGFQVNEAVQNEAFSGHLWKTYTGLYVVGYLLAVLVLKFIYPLTKEKTAEMLQDLADKRNATTAE